MFIVVEGKSLNSVFYDLICRAGILQQETRRGSKQTLDSSGPVCIQITNPRRRVLTVPCRNGDFPATCAETLWVLAGKDNLDFLGYYLPRAKDFSDDFGVSWRASYGQRLRRYGPGQHDQLAAVAGDLVERPNSRRAVMTLLEPENDHANLTAKDYPCTGYLSFMPRQGKLDLLVDIRSNDLLWGFSGVNVFEWTVLQELVSLMTGIPLGIYYQVSNSLHYYTEFESRFAAMRVAERFDVYSYLQPSVDTDSTELKLVDVALEQFFGLEAEVRAGSVPSSWGYLNSPYVPRLLRNLMRVVLAALLLKTEQSDLRLDSPAYGLLNGITDDPMRIALLEWIRRTWKMDQSELAEMNPLINRDLVGAYVAGLL